MSDDLDQYMPVEELAALLGLSPRQASRYGAGDAPKLRTRQLGKRILYHRDDAQRLRQELEAIGQACH
jgi:hypothetical protein